MSNPQVLAPSSAERADFTPPGWLLAALQPANGTPHFQACCLEAVEAARSLARLRYASQRLGFSFLTVSSYLRGLSAVARVPLETVLRWAGLNLDGPVGPAFARGWSNLARTFGLGLREALWHLRLTFAEEAGFELPALASARASDPSRLGALSAEYEKAVDQAIPSWEATIRERLRDCERLVRDEYRAADEAVEL